MKYKSAKLTNDKGKMWHIGLDENDIGKHVILPADPARCEMVAKYFDESRLAAVSRGNPTYTGTYNDVPVSVMCTGMGAMAVAVSVEELNHIGAKTLIRMGTCGAFNRNIPDGSIIIATAAVRDEGASREYIDLQYPAVADNDVVSALKQACKEFGVKPYVGIIRSHDAFYMESPGAHEGLQERVDKWEDANVLAVENESSALFTVSSLLGGLRAGTILLAGGYICSHYGTMSGASNVDYPARVELMTKITLRAIEIIDKLDDLEDYRK